MQRSSVVLVVWAGCAACRSSGGGAPGARALDVEKPLARAASATSTSATVAPSKAAQVEATRVAVAPTAALPRIETEWCGEGLFGLDAATCYRLPPPSRAVAAPRRLLVYLHGVVPPQATSPQQENFQRAVVRAGERAGATVLVPRGRRGVGPKATRTWWAWPASQPAYGRELDAIVDGWKKAKAVLEAAQGAPFDRTYLAGSSNGAYFVTRLVLRGDLEPRGFHVDGFGAMSGGSAAGRGASSLEGREVRRFYVGFGSHDPASKEAARPLVALLRAAGWPVRVAEHPVGHGAREIYIDEAFAFWDAARTPDGG